MKSLIKAFGLLAVASIVSGFAYAHYQATHQYNVYFVKDRLRASETVEGIASQHYNHKLEDRNWEEFRYDVTKRNAKLFANGRIPQIGDVVEIECHERIQK